MSGLLDRMTGDLVVKMPDDKLVEWWRELYADPMYSHPQMDIQKLIEDELERRGLPHDFETLSAGLT